MTTILLEVEDDVVAKATEVLARRHATVREELQNTLREIAQVEAEPETPRESFGDFIARFARFDTGGPYTRDEMNER